MRALVNVRVVVTTPLGEGARRWSRWVQTVAGDGSGGHVCPTGRSNGVASTMSTALTLRAKGPIEGLRCSEPSVHAGGPPSPRHDHACHPATHSA